LASSACNKYTPVCGRRQHTLTKKPFNHVVGSTVAFYFSWCGACWRQWSDLSLVNFLLFFFFLSSPSKLHVDSFCCWYFNSSYSFDFLFLFLVLCKSFICFQFCQSIPIWHILFFFNLVLILLIFYFFIWSFCKRFIGFQFHPSIQFTMYYFFSNLILILFIYFPLLKLFFFSI